ncbi:MAG: PhnD/SsuA/transferrin family substrate-binding protein [Gammaproteobacteria bacterium]|nr:PhnD/SsuA/transferrin family substrate-binding protein [Gammaproteobacteria bacterium]
MRKYLSYVTLMITLSVMAFGQTVTAGDYKIGVLAKRGPAKAIKKWGATAEYLTQRIEADSFTLVPLDFDEVFPAIASQEVDFFLVNSSMFVTAQVKHGAEAIATMINSRQGESLKSFGGVVFTYIDRDDINDLADIKGKNFMAVKESSFGGWQMAYKELLQHGIDPTSQFASLQFGGKHDNVVYAVQNGEVDAGTVRTDTLERMTASGDIDLSEFKILATKRHSGFPFVVSTPLYPEWPMAKLASTPADVSQRVVTALTELKAADPAAKAAKIVGWSAPLNYQDVEELQKLLKVGAYR